VLLALSLKSRTHAHPLAPARPVRRQHPAVLTAPAAEANDHPWKSPHWGGFAVGEGASERRAPAVGLRSPSQQWGRGVNLTRLARVPIRPTAPRRFIATYRRLAEMPEQHQFYLRFNEVFTGEPTWEDVELAWGIRE
jgi:hypothetical protein